MRVSEIRLLRISCWNRDAALALSQCSSRVSLCWLGIMDSHQFGWKGDHLTQPLHRMGPSAKLAQWFLLLSHQVFTGSHRDPLLQAEPMLCPHPLLEQGGLWPLGCTCGPAPIPSTLSCPSGFCCRGILQPWDTSCLLACWPSLHSYPLHPIAAPFPYFFHMQGHQKCH